MAPWSQSQARLTQQEATTCGKFHQTVVLEHKDVLLICATMKVDLLFASLIGNNYTASQMLFEHMAFLCFSQVLQKEKSAFILP